MAPKSIHGQALVEICVVIALVFLIAFAAISQLTEHKRKPAKYHFTKDMSYDQKNNRSHQK